MFGRSPPLSAAVLLRSAAYVVGVGGGGGDMALLPPPWHAYFVSLASKSCVARAYTASSIQSTNPAKGGVGK
jgi:hypothetical protein